MSGVPDWQIEREPMVNALACLRQEIEQLKELLVVERSLSVKHEAYGHHYKEELDQARAEIFDLKTALQVAVDELLVMQLARDAARDVARELYRVLPFYARNAAFLNHPWLEEEV